MVQPTGVTCPACSNTLPIPSIAVQLELQIRQHVSKYYLGYTICDAEGCGARTRQMGVYGRRCLGLIKEGCKGSVHLEYSDSKLYNQLLYYLSLFDSEKALSTTRGTARYEEVRALVTANQVGFAVLEGVVNGYLEKNGRRYVDMKGLFGFMNNLKV